MGVLFPSRDAFKYLERGMKCVGWISPERSNRFYCIYIIWALYVHTTAEIYLPIVFISGYFIDLNRYTPEEFLSSVQAFFNVLSLTFKVAIIFPNMWRFQRAKELLDNLDEGCIIYEHRVEIHRCVVRCNFVFMMYQTAYTVYATMNFLLSALTGTTPWVSYNPFVDFREGKKSLWIAATYEYVVGSSAVYADQMADVYPVIFGLILRTHIELLTRRVQRLRTDPAQTERQSYEELVNCIKDHTLVLQ